MLWGYSSAVLPERFCDGALMNGDANSHVELSSNKVSNNTECSILTAIRQQIGRKDPRAILEIAQIIGDGGDGSTGHGRLGLNHEEGQGLPVEAKVSVIPPV